MTNPSYLPDRRTLGLKIEGTPYTAETLAATDFNIPAQDIDYDPDIAMMAYKIARGDMSWDPSISGKRGITVTFVVFIYKHTTVATAPAYYRALRACAMKQTTHGSTGVSLITHSGYTNVPVTIEVVEKAEGTTPNQVVVKARGCMGNAKLVLNNVGEPERIEFEFTGVLLFIGDRAFGDILTPTGFDAGVTTPEAVLGVAVSLFGETQQMNQKTIDLGNNVQLFTGGEKDEGWEGAHVVSRRPTLELDPDLVAVATHGDFARWSGNNTGAFAEAIGTSINITAPAVQYTKLAPGSREEHTVINKTCELQRGAAGDDELEILQGSKT